MINDKQRRIVYLNPMNFDRIMQHELVLIDFWAAWCRPCRVQDPVLEEIAAELGDKLLIAKMDVDDNRYLSQKLGVRNIPALLLYRQGKEVERLAGIHSKDLLMKILSKHLNSNYEN